MIAWQQDKQERRKAREGQRKREQREAKSGQGDWNRREGEEEEEERAVAAKDLTAYVCLYSNPSVM